MATILNVDDDEDLADKVRRALHFDSHVVEHCASGRDGLLKLQAKHYDLVILDWQLPDLTGPEICRAYRQAGGSAPILMLTGKTSSQDKETGLDAGADDFLTKPFDVKELAARVRALLRRSARSAENANSKSLWSRIDQSFESGQDPFIGTTLGGKYDVLSFIGLGGMGVVYKAHHNLLKRSVAIKILLPHLANNTDYRKRLQQEAEAASRLAHPNIVSVYDYGMAARGLPFIVMDFLQGKSLSNIIADDSPLSIERCLNILTQVCDGIEHAHNNKVIHRDLKPSNLLLTTDAEQVKILDFGLAKPLAQEGDNAEKLTRTGMIFGSPEYMSPEQANGALVDHRSDVYSFGCLMFELLSGKPPFDSDEPIKTLMKQIHESPPALVCPQLNAAQRDACELIILKAMAKDPGKRYQSMAELRKDLEKIASPEGLPSIDRYKSLWNINVLRLAALAGNQALMLKTAVLVLLLCVIVLGATLTYWIYSHH